MISSGLETVSKLYDQWIVYENTCHGIRPRDNNPLATYTEFPKEYCPGAPAYELPLYTVARATCTVFTAHQPSLDLLKRYLQEELILFPVHPVNVENDQIPHIQKICLGDLSHALVKPTSSTRTTYVLGEPTLTPHCIKMHTDLRITRWRRHMERRQVSHAVAVTRIFEASTVFGSGLAYFPESIGAVYGTEGRNNDWGFIIREMESRPYQQTLPHQMIPLNALYIAPDSDMLPLLARMIEQSDCNPIEFITQKVIQPLLEGWISIYLETGILLEPHGQNVIVELDEDGAITRFAHRDFDCDINRDIVEEKGYSLEGLNQNNFFSTAGDDWAPQGAPVSIVFDNSVRVVLEALANLGQRYFEIDPNNVRENCRSFLSSHFQEFLSRHLPSNGKAYNLSRKEGGIEVIEKEHAPDWRST